MEPHDKPITRRDSLVRLAGLAAVAAGGAAWKTAESDAAGPKAVASGLVTCVLSPEMTEGPYYVAADAKLRKDIRAGRPGTPLALKLGVANVATCKPVKGAAVDIWHADAGGVYSDERRTTPSGRRSCAASRRRTRAASRRSRRSTPAGIRAARCTST